MGESGGLTTKNSKDTKKKVACDKAERGGIDEVNLTADEFAKGGDAITKMRFLFFISRLPGRRLRGLFA